MSKASTAFRGASLRSPADLDPGHVAVLVGIAFVGLTLVAFLLQIGPLVPVALVAFAMLTVRAVANPRFGLAASLVASLTIPVQLSFRVGPLALSPGRLLGFAFLIGWIASLSRPGGSTLHRTALDVGIGALVLSFGLSIVANSAAMSELAFGEAVRKMLVFTVDYFAFFYATVSVVAAGRRHLDLVLRVAAMAAVGTAVLGVIEQMTGRNVFTFLEPILPFNLAEYIRVIAENSVLTRGLLVRVRSTFEGPHAFGAVLTMAMPLLLHFWTVSTGRRRWLYVACITTVALAAMATASRGVYLAVSLTLVAYGVASGRVEASRRRVAALVVVLAILAGSNADLRATMSLYFRGLANLEERSIQGRIADYTNVAQQLDQSPLTGSGPGTWELRATLRGDNSLVDPDEPAEQVLDNYYLLVLAELGLFGLFAFILTIIGGVLLGWRAVIRARGPTERSLAASLFASLAGFAVLTFVFDMFAFNGPVRFYFVILAAAVVLSGAERGVPRAALLFEKRGNP